METLQRQTVPTAWEAFILRDYRLFCITNGNAGKNP